MEKPPLKRHRLDRIRATILNEALSEQAYVAGSIQVVATFEIIYFDPKDQVSKHGTISAEFAHGLPPGNRITRPELKDLDTWSKFDGEFAWASTGISRATLELFENFHPERSIAGRRQEAIGDIRRRAFDMVWDIYEKTVSQSQK